MTIFLPYFLNFHKMKYTNKIDLKINILYSLDDNFLFKIYKILKVKLEAISYGTFSTIKRIKI